MAVWAPGLEEASRSGPWLALNRLLTAYRTGGSRRHELVLFGSSDEFRGSGDGGYERHRVPRIPLWLERRYRQAGCDVVLTNGIPSTLGSLQLHHYRRTPWLVWVHGTLAFVDDYRIDGPIRRRFPHSFARRWTKAVMRRATRRSHRLIANSEFTKRVLGESVGTGERPTTVLSCGLDHDVFRPVETGRTREVRARLGLPEDFILSVAVANPVKNPSSILAAFARVAGRLDDAHLVLAGERWTDDLMGRWIDSGAIRRRVHAVGFADEERLAALYSGARMLLFPTLHETFGMPPLEAMACGCPVVSSSGTAVPEVCGDAAILVDDPQDVDDLASTITRVWRDEDLRERMRRRGFRRARRFSWRESADRLEEVLDRTEQILSASDRREG